MGAFAANAGARAGLVSCVKADFLRLCRDRRARAAALVLLSAAALLSLIAAPSITHLAAERPTVSNRAADRLDLAATIVAYEIQLAASNGLPTHEQLDSIRQRLAALALADQRVVYVSDINGTIASTTSPDHHRGRLLSEVLGNDDVEAVGTHGSVIRTNLRDGTPVIATFRSIAAGHIAVIQPCATLEKEHQLPPYAPEAFGLVCAAALAGLLGCLRYRGRARQAKRDRRRIAQQLDTSLTHGRCGVWDWDVTRDRVSWSPSLYALLGYEPRGDHLSATEVAGLLHPDDGDAFAPFDADAAPTDQQFDRQVRVRTAAQGWIWLRIKGETLIDPTDGTRHVVGLALDVTAERRAAERRMADDDRLREAVDAVPQAFVLWDSDDRLVLCNSKFLSLNGVPATLAVPGMTAEDLLAAGRAPISSVTLPAIVGGTSGHTMEVQVADGRWFHVSERRTADGGTVSIGTDVSDLKRKEARLREREKHLQGSVQAAETRAQCFAAAAERNYEANAAKTRFLSRMSHELRTPLNAIIGFSDVMRQQMLGPIDERYVGYTSGIHTSGLKLLEVIDGILQMTRIEKGQFTLTPEVMLLDDAIGEAVELVREEAQARHVTIETDTLGPILLQADGQAMREILTQLVRNAVKFSRIEGHVRIRARVANAQINVFVEDAGAGIPADILPRLGRAYEQVESEYSRSGGGAGLGLAITQALVRMHGGRLKLRSETGAGTIAMVHLPRVQPAANDGEHREPLLEAAE